MSQRSVERQVNLLAAFLRARDGLCWPDIEKLAGYDDDLPMRSRQKRFERDMDELRSSGLVFQRETESSGRQRYTLDRAACLLPPLHLSPEQRMLLFQLGLAYLEHKSTGPLQHNLATALLKVQAGAGRDGLPAVVPPSILKRSLYRRESEAGRFDALCAALMARRRVKFRYDGADGKAGQRIVAPYGFVTRRGGWYLVGLDLDRKAVRTFKVARIRGAVSQATPRESTPEYEVPAGFDAERHFSTEAFGAGNDSFRDVAIRFDREVAFIVENEFAGAYRIEPGPDGAITLHIPQAYPGELLRYLCEFPGHWEVLRPAGLRALVVARLEEALQSATRKGRR